VKHQFGRITYIFILQTRSGREARSDYGPTNYNYPTTSSTYCLEGKPFNSPHTFLGFFFHLPFTPMSAIRRYPYIANARQIQRVLSVASFRHRSAIKLHFDFPRHCLFNIFQRTIGYTTVNVSLEAFTSSSDVGCFVFPWHFFLV
jgi:hypothetical protein